MKVKIIEEESKWDLERQVNEILSNAAPDTIFDIKYCGETNHPPYSCSRYSAMIIYK